MIEVNGTSYLDGPCDFAHTSLHGPGSFLVEEAVGYDTHGQFAYVDVEGDRATARWNGPYSQPVAIFRLTDLKREGACWVSEVARVCAYR